jgi:hypothetical protein
VQLSLPLAHAAEAERLRTAIYRFAEGRRDGRDPPPVLMVPDERGWVSLVEFRSPEEAAEFRGYWARFRAEPFAWAGFRDV